MRAFTDLFVRRPVLALVVKIVIIVAGLQAWRSLKRLRRHVFRELDVVAGKAETTVLELESVSDTAELDRSIAGLRQSLAKLAVLRAAWDEATAFTALVPRK